MFSRDSLHMWVLAAALTGVVGGFLAVRSLSLPPTWGQNGHYRGAALTENAGKARKVTTRTDCLACHETPKHAFGKKHQRVLCTECHGQGRAHIDDCTAKKAALPADVTLTACQHDKMKPEAVRDVCIHCHAQTVGRPKDHPQIVVADHLKEQEAKDPNGPMACLQCHLAHNPSDEPEDDSGDKDDDDAKKPSDVEAPAAATPATAATPTAAPPAAGAPATASPAGDDKEDL